MSGAGTPARTGPAAAIHAAADRGLRALEFIALLVASALLLTAMALVSADALLRYAINAPLTFQYTLTEDYLLVGLLMMAMPWGFRTGGFIRIDGLAGKLPPRFADALIRAGLIASAGYIGVLAWTAGEHWHRAWTAGEAKIGVIDWPVHLSWIPVPVGLSLLAIRLALTALGPAAGLAPAPTELDDL